MRALVDARIRGATLLGLTALLGLVVLRRDRLSPWP